MMQITVQGVDKAVKDLEKYANADIRMLEVAYRLCAIGSAVATAGYGSHASVTATRTSDGAKVSIDGEDVLFIEFGTGDAAGIHAAQYDAVPEVVRPGSWSEEHAHQYERLGFWFWHNTMFTETPPHPWAYDAYQEMVQSIPRVVNEVFR